MITEFTMRCKFPERAPGVNCSEMHIEAYCKNCGWNPAVEARRKKKIKEERARVLSGQNVGPKGR